jgi:hypothetical protein
MKKLFFLIMLSVLPHIHQSMIADNQDTITEQIDTLVSAGAVDVQALDDLIDVPDFPVPEQLHIPTWKMWLIKTADTMIWTVKTGKEAIMATYDRCKRLIIHSEDTDEIES